MPLPQRLRDLPGLTGSAGASLRLMVGSRGGVSRSAADDSTATAASGNARAKSPTLTYACTLGGTPADCTDRAHEAAPPADCSAL